LTVQLVFQRAQRFLGNLDENLTMTKAPPDQQLTDLFLCAVKAVSAECRISEHLPPPPTGRTVVVGAGKAAAAMARAAETSWPGALSGAVVTPYGHKVACNQIEVIEAAHPVPDEAATLAAGRILDLVSGLTANDMVLALFSGGGSALLTLPAPGLTLADKQAVTRALLRSGAPISDINTVRKHLSAIKGGRLAQAAHPASLVTLVMSDVPGDNPATVASGPTLPDPTSVDRARAVLADWQISLPPAVTAYLDAADAETPKPGDPGFSRDDCVVVARAHDALAAASHRAENHGWTVDMLGDTIEGEARNVARSQAAKAISASRQNGARPHLLLSGGETTVTIAGQGGKGGRNTEYLLALALALEGQPDIWAIACDTDGIDGNIDSAGAILTPDSLERARSLGMNPERVLENHDSATLFAALDDLIQTGPTRTNVNDFRAILINAGTDAEVDL
jgi:hydroxypyruvate reductase